VLVVVPRIVWLYAVDNYFPIIQLDDCIYSFCCHSVFMMKIKFSMNLVNNKIIDNLLIFFMLNFHSYRPDGLRVIAV
jgi:hypothetical protein